MTERRDIRIDLSDRNSAALEEALGRACAGTTLWTRDGILEEQVSTNEAVQICFRHDPGGERPRVGICLAGPPQTLTVAAVVPIDRGVELDDAQYDAIVEEFYDAIVGPALESSAVSATLLGGE